MMTPRRSHSDALGSTIILTLGVALVFGVVLLHLALPERHARIEAIPLVVGFVMALGAAYWKDPNRAKLLSEGVTEAGGRVVESVVKLRTGRGRSAPTVEIKKTVDAAGENPATEVKVVTAQPDPTPLDEMDIPPVAGQ